MLESLVEFFGIEKRDFKFVRDRIRKKKIVVNKGKLLFSNTLLDFELSHKIKPSWSNKKLRIFFKEAYEMKASKEDVLAYFVKDKRRFPAIVLSRDKLIYNFDPEAEIENLLNEFHTKKFRPLYTYLPFHYHKIPFNRQLNKLLIKFLKDTKKFPSWPIDNSVDTIRYSFLKSVEDSTNKILKTKEIWPNNKKFAIVISHDVDKKDGLRNADKFLELESRKGLRSTWFLLSNYYPIGKSFLERIANDGNEIALHGYNHDNKIAYLDESSMKMRIKHGIEKFKEYEVKGFRTPALLTTPRFERILSNYFLYDSSVVDTELFLSDSINSGCCTVFPFYRNRILHLPITIPIDSLLIFRDFTPEQIYSLWIKKVEHIRKVGGLALIATHSESSYIADEKYFPAYIKFIEYISKLDDAWITTCYEIADWWKKTHSNS